MTQKVDPVARLPEEWEVALAARGERRFRAGQVFKWIHGRGQFDPHAMTDLGLPLREWLAADGLRAPGEVVQVHRSTDGTRKLIVALGDGARVECVLIPMTSDSPDADVAVADDDEEEAAPRQRVTLCVSTQYGCAMGCTFCASGRAGLGRGLGAHEIVAQVALARRSLEPGEVLTNLVFMGMGEPLHHYDETARALRLLTHEQGSDMSLRRITVSTVGLVPGIRRLGEDFAGKVGLAVSLHAPDDATRSRIVPLNERYPLRVLMQALRDYPLPRRRRITIEYTLIAGVNDADAQARALVALLRGLPVKVNLIPLNAVPGTGLTAASAARVATFREVLAAAGVSCFVRTRRGDDVAAACGQLAIREPPAVPLRPSKLSRGPG